MANFNEILEDGDAFPKGHPRYMEDYKQAHPLFESRNSDWWVYKYVGLDNVPFYKLGNNRTQSYLYFNSMQAAHDRMSHEWRNRGQKLEKI